MMNNETLSNAHKILTFQRQTNELKGGDPKTPQLFQYLDRIISLEKMKRAKPAVDEEREKQRKKVSVAAVTIFGISRHINYRTLLETTILSLTAP